MLNASLGVQSVLRRLPRTPRRRSSLARQARTPLTDGVRSRLRTAAAAAHLFPTVVIRRKPAPGVELVRPIPAANPGFLTRFGHERACAIVVAGVIGVATVLSVAPATRQIDATTVASIESAPSGPVGGPRGNGAAPRLVAGAFGAEQSAVANVPYAPAAPQDIGQAGAVSGVVGYAPVRMQEEVSGPFLEDGTLLKPVSVNTTVPDAKGMLRKHTVKAGETLASLGAKYHLDKATIYWASKLTSQKLRPGQKLTIPPVNGLVVRVRTVDSLESLAKKYKVKADDILKANELEDPNLVMGQVLIMPGAKGDPMPKLPKPKAGSESSSGSSVAPPARYRGGKFAWPVAGGTVSQGYHYGHYGIDISADSGTRVSAAAAGRVTFAGWKNNGGGYQVWIAHGSGLFTTYNHMSSISVGTGQSVGRGQQVGRVGMTGNATGPHLHFEVWRGPIWDGGTRVNPLGYL